MEGGEFPKQKKTETEKTETWGDWKTLKDTSRKIKETETDKEMGEMEGDRDRGGHEQAL